MAVFLIVLVVAAGATWRFVRGYQGTVLVCPTCSRRVPLSISRSFIACRCGTVLRRGGQLVEGAEQESYRLFS